MKFKAFYCIEPKYIDSGKPGGPPRFTSGELEKTHILVAEVEASSIGLAWEAMQSENMDPSGSKCLGIKAKGLTHCSMSINDVFVDDRGATWECVSRGWQRLEVQ